MEQRGTRVSLRAVIGGLCVPGYVRFLWEANDAGRTSWLVIGYLSLASLAGAGFVWMRLQTRGAPERRCWQRWLIDTMKLAGTLVVVGCLVFIAVRCHAILADRRSAGKTRP